MAKYARFQDCGAAAWRLLRRRAAPPAPDPHRAIRTAPPPPPRSASRRCSSTYFFFIGRFGVRVGDRVTISGITGDVIEVGIFRLYLMELGGKKPNLHPTGRIIVFSNAMLFQPSAFYKQLPGGNYSWHEVAFTLAPETDFKVAESRLLGAVRAVYEAYQDDLRNQHRGDARAAHGDGRAQAGGAFSFRRGGAGVFDPLPG